MKKFRIQLVIAAVVFVCGVSLCGLIYIIGNKPAVYVNPGVVSAPSPKASPVHPVSPSYGKPYGLHHGSTLPSVSSTAHPHAWSGASYRLFETSSATVKSIGGGGGYGIATTSHGSSSRGIITSSGNVAMPVTTFVSVASSRQMAQPEAKEAPEVAQVLARKAPGPPNPTDPLDEQHQLVEQPIGDALIPLLLLAIGYAALMQRNKKRRLAA